MGLLLGLPPVEPNMVLGLGTAARAPRLEAVPAALRQLESGTVCEAHTREQLCSALLSLLCSARRKGAGIRKIPQPRSRP